MARIRGLGTGVLLGLLALPLAAVFVATVPAAAAAEQAGGWRKEIADKAAAAQEAGKKGDFREAIRLLQEARARGALQPAEEQGVNELLIWAASSVKDHRLVIKTVDERIATGRVSGRDLVNKLRLKATSHYALSDFRGAIDALQRLATAQGSSTADDLILLGNSQFQVKDYRAAASTLDRAVTAAEKAGKPARTIGPLLEMLNKAYFELADEPKRLVTLHRLMAVAPKNNVFDQLVNAYQRDSKGDAVVMVNLYRLGAARGLLSADHYIHYAEAALDLSSPGEAVAMIEKGMSAGAIKRDDRNNRLLADAKGQVEKLKSSVAQQEREAMAMASGDAEARLATVYFTLRNFPKATEAARRGVDKGRVRRADDLHMLLGIALVETRKATEARNAFKAAGAANAQIRGVADLWTTVAT
ncbi:MAG: tetratricopeptide repeat protein [Gammaproteobacteria bacterium]|nr:tetratricopeptide repeat protein [Gammaproteobacteria bacterium]